MTMPTIACTASSKLQLRVSGSQLCKARPLCPGVLRHTGLLPRGPRGCITAPRLRSAASLPIGDELASVHRSAVAGVYRQCLRRAAHCDSEIRNVLICYLRQSFRDDRHADDNVFVAQKLDFARAQCRFQRMSPRKLTRLSNELADMIEERTRRQQQSRMQLFGGAGSPYARLTRIAVFEKQLEAQVEMRWAWATTSQQGSLGPPGIEALDPRLVLHNPSGQLPFLLLLRGDSQYHDGSGTSLSAAAAVGGMAGLEGTYAIVEHLDGLHPPRQFASSTGWVCRAMEATAQALLDGLWTWAMERSRPAAMQCSAAVQNERRRAERLLNLAEQHWVEHPHFDCGNGNSRLNLAQLFLFGALDVAAGRLRPEFDWQVARPRLRSWYATMLQRRSVQRSGDKGVSMDIDEGDFAERDVL